MVSPRFALVILLISIISLINLALASPITPRDSPTGRCGAQFGGNSCTTFGSANHCCSQYGYCGDSTGHCGNGCQPAYGSCSSPPVQPPTPTVTNRPNLGSVPYGSRIDSCVTSGDIALTFDDGPWQYTSQLLDLLRSLNVHATFFVTGNNLDKGAIDENSEWSNVIRRAYNEGHQIASHTWDHLDLNTLSENDKRFQMIRLEQALLRIIGRYPTYMRPPFIRCDGACAATLGSLGYHVIIWDLDTDDYNNDSPTMIENSKTRVREAYTSNNPGDTSFLSIAHDIHYQTVASLTQYQIELGRSRGFRHVRLGECMNDPQANWYRTIL